MSARTIIVTGAFGTLGSVVAKAFADAGDKVARVDYAPAPEQPLDGGIDLGGKDLSDADTAKAVVAEVAEKLGSIDVLVNIAGGFVWETLDDGDTATWQRMFALNAMTCANMCKAALPELMKASGAHIVNIGAKGALAADAGMGSYGASKSAVHKLTESLAAEMSGKDITVNAILPTIIDTEANRKDMPDADFSEWVKPQAIADVIMFLASDKARAINGALVPVSRGA